jgi:hypothetical protein
MPKLPRNILKSFFEKGDRPTSEQFAALIDSGLNVLEDKKLLGLKLFNPAVAYSIDDTAIYNGFIYRAIANTSIGPFVGAQWEKITFSALNLVGTWDAATNSPVLQSGVGSKGDYYIVAVNGNTVLDGVSGWQRLDFAVYSGTAWEKISAAATEALRVSFDPVPSGMNAENVQDAIDEIQLRVDSTETSIGTLQNTKADKVITAAPGKLPAFAVDGDLVDSGKSLTDFLHKTNEIAFVPTDLYHPATKDYVDTSLELVAIKPDSPIDGHFAGLDATGNLTDSGKQPSDYLHKTNTDSYEPASDFHPATKKYVDGRVADPANISQTSSYRFVSDAEKTTWNGKQDALGFTAVPDTRTINGYALNANVALTQSDVGLSNVNNTSDANKPVSTAQQAALDLKFDSANFASTALATILNGLSTATNAVISASDSILSAFGKLQRQVSDNLATFNARTVNGHALSSDVTVTKSDVGLGAVTDDQQLAHKFYGADESTIYTTTLSGYTIKFTLFFTPAIVADYLLEWYFEIGSDSASGGAGAQVTLDGTQLAVTASKIQIANSYVPVNGFIKISSLSTAGHKFSIELSRPSFPGVLGNTLMQRARLKVTKV